VSDLLYGFEYESGPMVVSALVGYMADAVELFQLNRSGCGSKIQKYKTWSSWYGISTWLVAELNLTKRLCTTIRPQQTLVGRPNPSEKKVALSVCVRCLSLRKSQTGDELPLLVPRRWALPTRKKVEAALPRRWAPTKKKAWKQTNWLSMEKPAPITVVQH
jgi:hypothetical protein